VDVSVPPVVRRDVPTPAGPIALLECDPGEVASRPPVLLIPGYTGSKEDFAAILGPIAAAGHRAVAMDQRGQFESPGPDDPAAYAVDTLAADVPLVAADIAGPGQPIHLLGHSFGGLVARAAVLADPARYLSLVLLCSGPSGIGGNRKQRMELLRPVLAAGGLPAVYEQSLLLAAVEPGFVPPPPPIAEFLRRRFLTSSAAGLEGMGDALIEEPDRVDALRGTGVRTLVAHGADDDAWPPAVQAEMATRLGARYVVIPASAHSPAAENPAPTASVLLDFWSLSE
jgi:pimeloyl-ACP methyl ester carboxylesterase